MRGQVIDIPEFRNRKFVFKNRVHAGSLISDRLPSLDNRKLQLLAIPSGGVPVGYSIAKKLEVPLDVIIVRKIQIPWNAEAGFGALAWDGTIVLNEALLSTLNLSERIVKQCISYTQQSILERVSKFRGEKPMPTLREKEVVLVDDGLASGFTMVVAIQAVRKRKPSKILVAVPTASKVAVEFIGSYVEYLLCLNVRSEPIFAVADAYEEWYDITDEETITLLNRVK